MDSTEKQHVNDGFIDLREEELDGVTGGANPFSGIKGVYEAGRDQGLNRVDSAKLAITTGPQVAKMGAEYGYHGSQEIRKHSIVRQGWDLDKERWKNIVIVE